MMLARRFTKHRPPWVLAAAAWLAVVAVPPVLAETAETAEATGGSGLVVELEGWGITPRNLDLDYAFVGVGSLSGGGDVSTLDHDRSIEPMYYAGWRLGTVAGTELGMRLWEYDKRSSSATGVFPLDVGALLASPDFLFSVVDSARAESELRATLVDATVRWGHDLGRVSRLDIETGVRLFRFEQQGLVAYRLEFGQVFEEVIKTTAETRGIGPRVAATYRRRVGRCRFGGALGLAAPLGELASRTLDESIVDGMLDKATDVRRDGTRRVFPHVEGRLLFEVDVGAGWTASLAYAFEQWSGVRQALRFVDEVSQNTTVPVAADVVFEGVRFGARLEF